MSTKTLLKLLALHLKPHNVRPELFTKLNRPELAKLTMTCAGVDSKELKFLDLIKSLAEHLTNEDTTVRAKGAQNNRHPQSAMLTDRKRLHILRRCWRSSDPGR